MYENESTGNITAIIVCTSLEINSNLSNLFKFWCTVDAQLTTAHYNTNVTRALLIN